MMLNRWLLSGAFASVAVTQAGAQESPRFQLPSDTVLTDAKIPTVISGLRPGRLVTIRLAGALPAARVVSSATFLVDRRGRVELERTAPIAGSYVGADAMGLFWSAVRDDGGPPVRPAIALGGAPSRAIPWQLVAEVDGRVVATGTVWRRAVAPDVRVTRVREAGVVGVLYEPAGTGRRPAIIVLPGSAGGTPGAPAFPGGLASRGYVALSLAYFNEEGLPPQLTNIPLEYFERAIEWLRARPSVDPDRIAILGGSRGGELALLLGATYPRLVRAIIAMVPSSVVWNGCCDVASGDQPSWTLKGAAVPFMPPVPGRRAAINELARATPVRQAPIFLDRLSDTAAAARAAIPVERIAGPVLLISGRDDRLWPSFEMAEQVVARLKRHGFSHEYRHVSYEGAGHAIGRPYQQATNLNDNVHPVSGQRNDTGGTPEATARAREGAWTEILAFLDRHLHRGDSRP